MTKYMFWYHMDCMAHLVCSSFPAPGILFPFMFIFWSKLCIWSFRCYILSCMPMCSECWEGSNINSATMWASRLWTVPPPFGLTWHPLMMARSWRTAEATIITPVKKSTQVEHLRPHVFTNPGLFARVRATLLGEDKKHIPSHKSSSSWFSATLLIHNPLNKNNN